MGPSPRVYEVTSYGADPTGKTDSSEAILRAISHAFDVAGGSSSSDGLFLMEGIVNLGGAHISLEGGTYTISRPLRLPSTGRANFRVYILLQLPVQVWEIFFFFVVDKLRFTLLHFDKKSICNPLLLAMTVKPYTLGPSQCYSFVQWMDTLPLLSEAT